MKKVKGVFLTDIHFPDNINLSPVFKFLKDYKPDLVVLGGDIIDAKGLHGVESFKVMDFNKEWYKRDVRLLSTFLAMLQKATNNAKVVFLFGNHEERYDRLMRKYPKTFGGDFDFIRDCAPEGMNIKGIPYGTYKSYFKIGDMIFIHGTVYPDNHAKKYALDNTPYKCMYGHLHHAQMYTTRKSIATTTPKYAVTPGCLCTVTPEWKRGAPNQWLNGFATFTVDGSVVTPNIIFIEKGKFYVGGKCYD